MYTLLQPIVSKNIITSANYSSLPSYLQPRVASFDHIWLVYLIPQAVSDPNTPCRVVVSAAANNRTGAVELNNNGRSPVSPPPDNFDDLRPISFYVWGVGSQVFKIRDSKDSSVYVETRVDFE